MTKLESYLHKEKTASLKDRLLVAMARAKDRGAKGLGEDALAYAKANPKRVGGAALGIGGAALLAKILKSRSASKRLLPKGKLTNLMKKHKKSLMIGGAAAGGAAGLGALLSS